MLAYRNLDTGHNTRLDFLFENFVHTYMETEVLYMNIVI
jgi:hypothetical protein